MNKMEDEYKLNYGEGGLPGYFFGSNPGGSPCILKIEASGNTINVECFATEEQTGQGFQLHGIDIYIG